MTGLERSCANADATDWIATAPERGTSHGIERIEARFAGHGYDPHRHDTYSLGITLAGVQTFDYRGARRDSVAGRAIVLHPDEVHDGRAGTEVGFRYRMLYLEPCRVREALGARASSLPFVRGGVSDDPGLIAAVRSSLEELSRPLESLELDQTVLELSEALLRLDPGAASRSGRARASPSDPAVATARELLESEAVRGVDSAELERATGVERHELGRRFRRRYGTSPYRYLTLRRLALARERIGAGEALGEAAAACGFSDQAHMTRAFGRAYGVTPGRWRRLVEASDARGAPSARTGPPTPGPRR